MLPTIAMAAVSGAAAVLATVFASSKFATANGAPINLADGSSTQLKLRRSAGEVAADEPAWTTFPRAM
jgi:hypothetical protein